MPDKTPTPETINETILRIIGLESLDGVSYDEYYRLLLEQLIMIESGESDLSTKEIKIIQEESKQIKPFAKKNPDEMVNEKLNVKKRTINRDKLFERRKKPKVIVKPNKSLVPKRIIRNPSGSENNEEALNAILGSVNNILQILQNQSSFEKKVYNKNRRDKEQERRTNQENKLESAFSRGIAGLKSISSKVFSPFQDIIGKLINFFTWIFLGKAFQSFMKWINDPKNEKKVEFLSNFLKTFWPAILAAVVLFLTPIGGLIRAVTATVIRWTAKLAKVAIPRLLKFIAKHPLAAGAIAVGAAVAGATVLGKNKEDENINLILQQEAEAEGKTLPEKQKENEQNKSWTDRFGDAFNFGNLGMGGVSPLGLSQGGTIPNVEHGYNGIDGNTGEDISGAGRDTQLIAARPGEVVLTPEDQSYIYQNTGFDIPGFVGNRKPKFISGSNLRFTNPSLFGKDTTRIPKFEAGGVVGGYKPSSGTKDFGEEPLVRVAMQNGIQGDELAAFLAQTSHETGEFKWKRELGGGKDSYSGGKKYHGRGYIQITHDYNYKHYGDKIGVDLVNNPDLALKPDIAARIAVEYWKENVRPTVKGNWKDPFLHSKAVNYPAASSPSQINGYQDRVKKFNYYRNNIQKITQKSAPKPEIKSSEKVLNSQKIGNSVYTERAGGVYTRNGVPISKDSYTKSVGSKKKFNPIQTIRNVASTVTGGGGRSAQAKPKPNPESKKSNHQKLVEKRPWFDKFGWFGGASKWNKKQGGGYIHESSGINIPGMTADRQLISSPFGPIAAQPGEYILPLEAVSALGGKLGVDKIVEKADSNSKAALDGKILNPISKDFGITPYKTDVEIASLPGMNMGGQGVPSAMSGEPGGSSEEFHSPISPVAGSTRATIFQILGIVA